MKPFDLAVALDGSKRIVNENNERYQVEKVTLFGEEMYFARPCNGSGGPCSMNSVSGLLSSGYQMYVAGEKYVKYVNIYPSAESGRYVSGKVLHDSEAECREVAGANLVSVARIEFEA